SQSGGGLNAGRNQVMVQQGGYTGEGGRARGCSSDDAEIAAGVNHESIVIGGRGEGNIGNVSGAVVRDAGGGLPGRFGEEDAGAAPACGQVAGGGIVPGDFRNIGQRGSAIREVGLAPVSPD